MHGRSSGRRVGANSSTHTHTHTHTHTGTVGGVTCVAVENVDGTAVHLVNGALEEGTQVDVHVDWPRLCSMNGACVFPS